MLDLYVNLVVTWKCLAELWSDTVWIVLVVTMVHTSPTLRPPASTTLSSLVNCLRTNEMAAAVLLAQ